MPKLEVWPLLSRIAAHGDRFEASAEVAEATALYIIRNQLSRATTLAQLRAAGEAVGRDAIVVALEGLSPDEAARMLATISPATVHQTAPRGAHAALITLIFPSAPEATKPPPAAPPTRQMRRHKAIGARRIRSTAPA